MIQELGLKLLCELFKAEIFSNGTNYFIFLATAGPTLAQDNEFADFTEATFKGYSRWSLNGVVYSNPAKPDANWRTTSPTHDFQYDSGESGASTEDITHWGLARDFGGGDIQMVESGELNGGVPITMDDDADSIPFRHVFIAKNCTE